MNNKYQFMIKMYKQYQKDCSEMFTSYEEE